jgi:hypothetical protein
MIEQSRAALEIVFSSSDDDDDFNFFGDADNDIYLVLPPPQVTSIQEAPFLFCEALFLSPHFEFKKKEGEARQHKQWC